MLSVENALGFSIVQIYLLYTIRFLEASLCFRGEQTFTALPHGPLGSDAGELDLGLNPLRQFKTEAPEQGAVAKTF